MINEKEMIDIIETLNEDKITTCLRKFSTRAWNAFCDDVEPKILKLKSYLNTVNNANKFINGIKLEDVQNELDIVIQKILNAMMIYSKYPQDTLDIIDHYVLHTKQVRQNLVEVFCEATSDEQSINDACEKRDEYIIRAVDVYNTHLQMTESVNRKIRAQRIGLAASVNLILGNLTDGQIRTAEALFADPQDERKVPQPKNQANNQNEVNGGYSENVYSRLLDPQSQVSFYTKLKDFKTKIDSGSINLKRTGEILKKYMENTLNCDDTRSKLQNIRVTVISLIELCGIKSKMQPHLCSAVTKMFWYYAASDNHLSCEIENLEKSIAHNQNVTNEIKSLKKNIKKLKSANLILGQQLGFWRDECQITENALASRNRMRVYGRIQNFEKTPELIIKPIMEGIKF